MKTIAQVQPIAPKKGYNMLASSLETFGYVDVVASGGRSRGDVDGRQTTGATNRVDGAACAFMLALVELGNVSGASGHGAGKQLKMGTAPNDAPLAR